jgi:hypothetical protein
VPVVVVFGIAGVIGLVAYLIWQSGQERGASAAERAEADASVELPGEWVNLAALYGGPYPDTANHVRREVDYSDQGELPPVGGPHWGSSACGTSQEASPPFCGPAPFGIFREPWEEEPLVHLMEHGGLVIWYNTDDQTVIDSLEAIVEAHLEDDDAIALVPYPEMEDDTVALTGWSRREKFPVSEYSDERVETFIEIHLCRFNPEDLPFC